MSAVFAYDITVLDKGGNPWEPESDSVSIMVTGLPEDTNEDATLLHGNEVITTDDGLSVEEGKVSFEAEHFSPFIVLMPNSNVSSGTWGNISWDLSENGTLTISGDGPME